MEPKEKPKGSKSILYFLASVALIIVAIIFTSILDSMRNSAPTDTRVRAANVNTLKLTAVVAAVDETAGIIVVDNLQFTKSGTRKNLGTWSVTPPASYTLTKAVPGKKVTLTVDPSTLLASTHTLTATGIR